MATIQQKRYPFPKNKRLLKPAEYQQAFAAQKKLYHKGIIIYYCENTLKESRLGLVIAKRHFKKAVTRNYLKRQIRESFRLHQQLLENPDSHKDIIVVATAKLIENKQCRISTLLDELWPRFVRASSLA